MWLPDLSPIIRHIRQLVLIMIWMTISSCYFIAQKPLNPHRKITKLLIQEIHALQNILNPVLVSKLISCCFSQFLLGRCHCGHSMMYWLLALHSQLSWEALSSLCPSRSLFGACVHTVIPGAFSPLWPVVVFSHQFCCAPYSSSWYRSLACTCPTQQNRPEHLLFVKLGAMPEGVGWLRSSSLAWWRMWTSEKPVFTKRGKAVLNGAPCVSWDGRTGI